MAVAASNASADDDREARTTGGPEWVLVVSPTAGYLDNSTTFTFEAPTHEGTSELQATLEDDGFGGGIVAQGIYRRLALTDVFFYFPDVNSSRIAGNIVYFSGTIPTGAWIEIYLGMGHAFVSTDTDYENFVYRMKLSNYVGVATFERISIDNVVSAPFPKVGIKIPVPIQHWYVQPFYSLMWEDVRTRARSPGGHVDVFEQGHEEGEPVEEHEVPAFDTNLHKEYLSNLVGMDWLVDFHYFLQLRGKAYYNVDYDLWTVRLVGTALLTEFFGVSVYFEYTEKVTVTNTYVLFGPAFVLLPPGFMDSVRGGESP